MTTPNVLTVCLLTLALALGGAGVSLAGPLSADEVLRYLHGVPTAMQVVACSSTSATASTAIPGGSVVRITTEGSKPIYFDFVAQAGSVTLTGGVHLPTGLIDVVQNGATTNYFACITRGTDTATASLAIMR